MNNVARQADQGPHGFLQWGKLRHRLPNPGNPLRSQPQQQNLFGFSGSFSHRARGGSRAPGWSFPITGYWLLSALPEGEIRVILNLARPWHSSREEEESGEPYPARERW